MNQVLHIFRKDVRQHWWEIGASLAMAVAYGWNESRHDTGSGYFQVGASSFLMPILAPLLVVAWALVIVRGVQAESLAGDRQFWVTRPYEWKKLLAAKVLFVVVFVNVPLLILQAFLLVKAGFPLRAHIPGLLGLQAPWLLILILPVATLTAVTESVGRFMLAVLGVLLYFVAIAVLGSLSPDAVPLRAGSVPMTVGGVILVATCLAVVLWQYARRRTAQARVVLLGALGAAAIVLFAAPYEILIARAYPVATPGQPMPVQLAFDPAKPTTHEHDYPEKDKVHVRIPLLVSGIADGSAVFAEGMMVSIDAPGGVRWKQGWRSSGLVLLPSRQRAQTDIPIDKDLYERVKATPVKLHITFALAPRHARETFRIVVQTGGFAVGGGRCSPPLPAPSGVVCVFPLDAPFLLVSAKADEIACAPGENESALPAGTIGYGWSSAAEAGISPVKTIGIWLWDWGEVKTSNSLGRSGICPGTPLTVFTNWEDAQPLRSEVEIDGIRLADYQLNDARM